ncbi:hypothetical protein BKA80DRAFT_69197 [Phyllosticta citrichinensis]
MLRVKGVLKVWWWVVGEDAEQDGGVLWSRAADVVRRRSWGSPGGETWSRKRRGITNWSRTARATKATERRVEGRTRGWKRNDVEGWGEDSAWRASGWPGDFADRSLLGAWDVKAGEKAVMRAWVALLSWGGALGGAALRNEGAGLGSDVRAVGGGGRRCDDGVEERGE